MLLLINRIEIHVIVYWPLHYQYSVYSELTKGKPTTLIDGVRLETIVQRWQGFFFPDGHFLNHHSEQRDAWSCPWHLIKRRENEQVSTASSGSCLLHYCPSFLLLLRWSEGPSSVPVLGNGMCQSYGSECPSTE